MKGSTVKQTITAIISLWDICVFLFLLSLCHLLEVGDWISFSFCTKIVGNTKYFNNFVCCDHRADVCYLFDYQL